jgi:nicotinamidase/pyrazinamidase
MLRNRFGQEITINESDAFVVIDMNKDMSEKDGALFIRGIEGEVGPDELIDNILEIDRLPFGYRVAVSAMYEEGHIEFETYPKHCILGSPGQAWPEKLTVFHDKADCILVKGTEEGIISMPVYAARFFFDFIRKLRKQGIKRIFCSGLAYTHCVSEAAIAFSNQGFEVYVIRNAARSVPPPNGDAVITKKKLELYGVGEIFIDSP